MSPALELSGITKRFATHAAVSDLSLTVPTGTIYGILGPNGAGKSTTLRMIMDILARDAGDISLLGEDPARNREVLRRVGYLPEERGLYRKMRALDVIVFFGQLKGMSHRDAEREARAWLGRMGLADWVDAKVETLSKGMQQKVQFIATVLHHPDVLILDEPHSGLDPVNQDVLQQTIMDARAEGRTVLLSTHNMTQAEQMCEHVCIIARGRKVLDGPVAEIRRTHRSNRYYIEFDVRTDGAARFMTDAVRFPVHRARGAGWDVELTNGTDVRALVAQLNSLDVTLCRFEHIEPTLHDIFVAHVGAAEVAAREPEARRAP
jgi:ABC-2 type transport system ATP-binding protein